MGLLYYRFIRSEGEGKLHEMSGNPLTAAENNRFSPLWIRSPPNSFFLCQPGIATDVPAACLFP